MFYSLILAMGGDIGAIYMLLLSVLLSGLVFAILIKRLPSSRMWKKIVLSDMTSNRQGYVPTLISECSWLYGNGTDGTASCGDGFARGNAGGRCF